MKIVRMSMPSGGDVTQAFASVDVGARGTIEIGTALLRAGERVPKDGESRHDAVEISYVLGGTIDVTTESGLHQISSGDLVIVSKGEAHHSVARQDATLIYAFLRE
jgi:uncharacterized cupin superfamily protein